MTVMFIMTGIFWKCVFLLYEDQYINRIYTVVPSEILKFMFFSIVGFPTSNT